MWEKSKNESKKKCTRGIRTAKRLRSSSKGRLLLEAGSAAGLKATGWRPVRLPLALLVG